MWSFKISAVLIAIFVVPGSLILLILGLQLFIPSVSALVMGALTTSSFEAGYVYGGLFVGPVVMYLAYFFAKMSYNQLRLAFSSTKEKQ
jgi:hypothetical protein